MKIRNAFKSRLLFVVTAILLVFTINSMASKEPGRLCVQLGNMDPSAWQGSLMFTNGGVGNVMFKMNKIGLYGAGIEGTFSYSKDNGKTWRSFTIDKRSSSCNDDTGEIIIPRTMEGGAEIHGRYDGNKIIIKDFMVHHLDDFHAKGSLTQVKRKHR